MFLLVLLMPLCPPAAGQSTAPAVPDAEMARKVEALDLSDRSKAQQQLDAMSAEEVARYLTDPRAPQFSWAMAALRKKGHAAIPHLVKLMGRNDVGYSPMLALLNIGDKSLPILIELLKGDNQTARRNAAWALNKRNKPCKDAIAPLIEVLKGKDEVAAGYAIAPLIPNGKDAADAVPHLIPLAFKRSRTSAAPYMAVEAIGLDPKLIPSVIEHVAVSKGDPKSDRLRQYVGARLLAAAGKDGAAALAKALGHKSQTVRLAAAQAIHKLGKQVKTDAVEKALNAAIADDATRVDAAAALVAIGASAKAAVPGLIKDLESGRVMHMASLDTRYECRAADVLSSIPEAVPALIEGLGSDKRMVRLGCAWAMVGLPPAGLPPVIEMLKGDDQGARKTALWVMMHRNKPCKDAIAPLIEILKRKNERAALYAAAALAPNGKDAADAVPHLIPLAFKIRARARAFCMAVEAIGLDPKLIPSVIEHVAVKEGEPKSEALRLYVGARLLAAAGKDGAAALAKALGHKSQTVRLAAAQAIHKLGKQVKTDAVEKALNAAIADDATRVDAAAALVAIGASAKAAVPGLIKDLESARVSMQAGTDFYYECRAADVLSSIPEAVPALIEGLGSDKEMVRVGCVWAMATRKATARTVPGLIRDRVVPKIKDLLARSTSQREQALVIEKLYRLDSNWVRQAARGDKARIRFPPWHWRDVTRAVVAAAKAETKKAAE